MKKYSILLSIFIMLLAACTSMATEPSASSTDTTAAPTPLPPSPTVAPADTEIVSDCQLPAVQPSDKLRLVYVTEGNLWLLDEGKEPVQMMDNGDVEQVMLSPDGSRIVVTRRRDANIVGVWVVDSLGWRELSGDEGISGSIELISFSDDGQLLIFSRELDFVSELWIADINNANVRRLVSREEELQTLKAGGGTFGVRFFEVIWIPGTHRLTFAANIFSTPGGGDSGPNPDPIIMVDADTAEQKVLPPTGEGGYITYSPDGKTMVIADPSRVRLMSVADLSEPQTILNYTILCDVGCFIAEPTWSLDSSSFLLALPSEGMNPDNFSNGLEEPFTIWDISADGNNIKRLGEIFRVNRPFYFSPDLKRVAYYRQESTRNLHIANVDGTQDVPYDSGVEFFGWAPDSQHFAYQAFQDMPFMYGDICGQATQLTDVVGAQFLGWLDATRIFLLVGTDFYLSPAGGISSQLLQIGAAVVYDYVLMPK